MKRSRLTATLAITICVSMLLQAMGCSSFRPLGPDDPENPFPSGDTRLQVSLASGYRFEFAAHQYALHLGPDSTVTRVTGWGDEYGPYGLIDRGYYDIPIDERTTIEVERVNTAATIAFAGALVGLGVVTFVGIKSFTSQSSTKSGDRPSPPTGN